MEAKRATDIFDPKKCYKQMTMNFTGHQDDYMENDDLMDENFVNETPQFPAEEGQFKNDFDVDMEELEESKNEKTSSSLLVPNEDLRQASKSLEKAEQIPVHMLTEIQGGHSMLRRQSDAQGGDQFYDYTSKRAVRQGSIDTHMDISAIDDEARRSSWNRLVSQNLEAMSAEQFDKNMRRLSDLEQERRKSSVFSGKSSKPTIKKTNIVVQVADISPESQMPIEA